MECVSGFRFKPNDVELILDYLMKKAQGSELTMSYNIHDVNLYGYDPDDLAAKHPKLGDNEWYFFTPLKWKGSRPSRSTTNGYWKATGVPANIFNTRDHLSAKELIGQKRTLVYFTGTPSRMNVKTDWIMQEFTLVCRERTRRGPEDMKVLCKMYKTRPVKKHTARFNERSCLNAVSEGSPVGIDGILCTEETGTSAPPNAMTESIHHIDPMNQVNSNGEMNRRDAIPHVLQEQNEDLTIDDYPDSGCFNFNDDQWRTEYNNQNEILWPEHNENIVAVNCCRMQQTASSYGQSSSAVFRGSVPIDTGGINGNFPADEYQTSEVVSGDNVPSEAVFAPPNATAIPHIQPAQSENSVDDDEEWINNLLNPLYDDGWDPTHPLE